MFYEWFPLRHCASFGAALAKVRSGERTAAGWKWSYGLAGLLSGDPGAFVRRGMWAQRDLVARAFGHSADVGVQRGLVQEECRCWRAKT
jgi:hypothetical protein